MQTCGLVSVKIALVCDCVRHAVNPVREMLHQRCDSCVLQGGGLGLCTFLFFPSFFTASLFVFSSCGSEEEHTVSLPPHVFPKESPGRGGELAFLWRCCIWPLVSLILGCSTGGATSGDVAGSLPFCSPRPGRFSGKKAGCDVRSAIKTGGVCVEV